MSRKSTVVILQGSDDDASRCREAFAGDFSVLYVTSDHIIALEKLSELKPDWFISSLFLCHADGFSVLKEAKKAFYATKCVVIDYPSTQEVIEAAVKAGADYYFSHAVDYPLIAKRLKDAEEYISAERSVLLEPIGGSLFRSIERMELFDERKIDSVIGRLFIEMGISPNIKGFNYLRVGIKLTMANPKLLDSVTKELYPMIGQLFGTSPSKVERAIRHALDVGWSKGNPAAIFSEMFGVEAFASNEKPTNSEFIALVADRLILQDMIAG